MYFDNQREILTQFVCSLIQTIGGRVFKVELSVKFSVVKSFVLRTKRPLGKIIEGFEFNERVRLNTVQRCNELTGQRFG